MSSPFNTPSVTKLPTEMILEVLKHSIIQDGDSWHDPMIVAMNASQVCTKWRSVALDYHSLWTTTLDLSKPITLLRNVVIPRCGHGCIDSIIFPGINRLFMEKENWELSSCFERDLLRNSLHLDAQMSDFLERLSLVTPLLAHRPKQIILKVPPQDWPMLDPLIFSQREMSQLETLLLIREKRDETNLDSDSPQLDESFTISSLDQALHSASSSWMMKTLGFQGCTAPIRSQALSMLEDLSISDLPTSNAYTPAKILEILEFMPQLKVLKLKHVTLTQNYHQQVLANLENPIELPNLEQLVLAAPLEHIRNMIYSINMPTMCRFDIIGDELEHVPDAYNRIQLVAQEIERKSSSNSIFLDGTSVSVEYNPQRYAISIIKEAPEGGNTTQILRFAIEWDKDDSSPFHFDHTLDVGDVSEILIRRLHRLCYATSLRVDLSAIPNVKDLIQNLDTESIISRFDSVIVLHIFNLNSYQFLLEYLQQSFSSGCSIDRQLLPSLKSLVFRKVDFSIILDGDDRRSLGEILLDFVKRRSFVYRDRDYSVKCIGTWGCTGLSLGTIVALKRYGADVTVMYR